MSNNPLAVTNPDVDSLNAGIIPACNSADVYPSNMASHITALGSDTICPSNAEHNEIISNISALVIRYS
jgi:hypothetical protein